ncbi:hypothetical protein ACFFX0_07435 [Citricoccus parietis]|uniref:Uncharacterized protein n=1 Tax=Citricoccus parietis TaxID=592307 RepID=A0ABV5FWJ1_9MICC
MPSSIGSPPESLSRFFSPSSPVTSIPSAVTSWSSGCSRSVAWESSVKPATNRVCR